MHPGKKAKRFPSVPRGVIAAGREAYDQGHIPGAVAANYKSGGWRAKVGGVSGMLPPVDKIEATIAALGVDADDHVVITAAGEGVSAARKVVLVE